MVRDYYSKPSVLEERFRDSVTGMWLLGCDVVAGLVDKAEAQPCPAGARAAEDGGELPSADGL